MTNMSPISLQLRPRERGNSEETDIRRPAVLQAGNGPQKDGLLEVDSCFFQLPKRPVSGLCRRPCQRFPPQAIRNQGSDMRRTNGGGVLVVMWLCGGGPCFFEGHYFH